MEVGEVEIHPSKWTSNVIRCLADIFYLELRAWGVSTRGIHRLNRTMIIYPSLERNPLVLSESVPVKNKNNA